MVVMVILVALFAGGGVALYLQLSSTRQAGLVQFSRAALFCSEAGLQAARKLILCQYQQTGNWSNLLDPDAAAPAWYPEVDPAIRTAHLADVTLPTGVDTFHALMGEAGDDMANDDWLVWVTDDDDEYTGANDPLVDNNLRIIIHSRCIMFPDQPREVIEVVRGAPNPTQYEDKRKGSQGVSDQTNSAFSDPCL